jgi:hypothetical protein
VRVARRADHERDALREVEPVRQLRQVVVESLMMDLLDVAAQAPRHADENRDQHHVQQDEHHFENPGDG